ncbi:hypothetical protein F5B22DRAFT_624249 [Xylaria bambusicola]|uniref:uncharacterized protein n=1 Tax=Xylaria bambusicola TaxID=326684 RepID=UPI0020074255|nr:uncharacterized protein F5B22DRAFT_624249 [Xylaria bambusicola]KAI0506262.1 hypothetical protein F5B22DRAFT_624249 [Xylaria bambusicola]
MSPSPPYRLAFTVSPISPSLTSYLCRHSRSLKSPSARYRDIHHCFAQDIRQLIIDEALPGHLVGLDIKKPLVELSCELFPSQSTLEFQPE